MRAHRVYGSAAEANVAVADRCLSAPGWPRPDLAGPYSRAAVLDCVHKEETGWRPNPGVPASWPFLRRYATVGRP